MSAAPVARTVVVPHLGLRRRARARVAAWPVVGWRIALFGLIILGTNYASSLGGQVILEKARRDAFDASRRAREAQDALATLRSGVDALSGTESVRSWARANGFVAPGAPAPTSTRWNSDVSSPE
jgi:hypothetical protein